MEVLVLDLYSVEGVGVAQGNQPDQCIRAFFLQGQEAIAAVACRLPTPGIERLWTVGAQAQGGDEVRLILLGIVQGRHPDVVDQPGMFIGQVEQAVEPAAEYQGVFPGKHPPSHCS
ncbi:hypothetical protein PBOI14_08360 [Pseudomonas sp. Boi14]|nr:hypothetical protein PBOI14_08360 [Pseudomonas sp. Boi14]